MLLKSNQWALCCPRMAMCCVQEHFSSTTSCFTQVVVGICLLFQMAEEQSTRFVNTTVCFSFLFLVHHVLLLHRYCCSTSYMKWLINKWQKDFLFQTVSFNCFIPWWIMHDWFLQSMTIHILCTSIVNTFCFLYLEKVYKINVYNQCLKKILFCFSHKVLGPIS